ncbi:unnamed protein product [Caenorhabditis auriculariae]|uniref:Chromatin assembly factor 1 subunit A dimerization domain-containing protein n=1 Tax=Caenorhabditis auriculariae TaxID=2777116 RepID=A0A8S1GU33_9PELO|nr:unnamed protein product [Caenorhabditis auriculariae]
MTTSDEAVTVVENNENLDSEDAAEKLKGVKRAASPLKNDEVKKPKCDVPVSSSNGTPAKSEKSEDEPEIVELDDEDDDDSPTKKAPHTPALKSGGAKDSGTPKTPKTPKVSKEEREQLRLKKLQEKEHQRIERERLLEEKRLEKEREKEEKRLEKERKEKERVEKKLEEERKKEEKRKEAEEKKRKEEEEKLKKKKEEDDKKEARRKEEEEKRDAKKKEEEAMEEKKRRESARFLGFFSKVEKKKATVEVDNNLWYKPFEMKPGMSVASILHREPVNVLNNLLEHLDTVTPITYLTSDAVKKRKILLARKIHLRAKLIQFHDNTRPPYYGTWRKKPQVIKGRRPFASETGIDYEVDSDAEWEDEPSDGEECRSDEEDVGDDEVMSDDGFFVPPCYLSDGEGEGESDSEQKVDEAKPRKRVIIEEDEGGAGSSGGGIINSSGQKEDDGRPENAEERRARLAARASEWARRVSRGGPRCLDSVCLGPCFEPPPPVATATTSPSKADAEECPFRVQLRTKAILFA